MRLSLLLGLCALAACDVAPGIAQQPVHAGQPDEVDRGFVLLTPWCSGTLIAPNAVLTAHHCVGDYSLAPGCADSVFTTVHRPSTITVSTQASLPKASKGEHAVQQVVVLPDPPDRKASLCGDDLAILVLAAPIAASEATPIVPRVDAPATAGEPFSAAGYGYADENDTGEPRTRRRRDGLSVSCVGAACPRDPTDVQPVEWVGQDELCHADSGGSAVDGKGRLIGVHDRGASDSTAKCTPTSVYVDVATRADWIKSTVRDAARIGGYDAPGWVEGAPTDPVYRAEVGAACTNDSTCPGLRCIEHVCSRPCNALAACPAEYTCDVETSFCAPPLVGCSVGGRAGGGGFLVAIAALLVVAWLGRSRG